MRTKNDLADALRNLTECVREWNSLQDERLGILQSLIHRMEKSVQAAQTSALMLKYHLS